MPIEIGSGGERVELLSSEELNIWKSEQEKKIADLRAALVNFQRMLEADPNIPTELVKRKSEEEKLTMAQDNFLLGLQLELYVMLKKDLLYLPGDRERLEKFKRLVDLMVERKYDIKEVSEKTGISNVEEFNKLRDRRIKDVKVLVPIIESMEYIIKDSSLQLGADFKSAA